MGKVPQGAVLFDHAPILALSVRSLDFVQMMVLLLNFTRRIVQYDIFLSICCGGVTSRGSCERVLAIANWCASV